ncbi:MAG: hypothetical protein PHH16_00585 [Candidatus Gracilibacteria bacterium]|nr:hypothetical protein [Candidatus Gracilibacteria bacterium]
MALAIGLIFIYGGLNAYQVVDNTNDGVHNGMASALVSIGTNLLNGTISSAQAVAQVNAYISQVSGGSAQGAFTVDAQGNLHIGCSNNGNLIEFLGAFPPSPPPPPPSCSYIASYTDSWSDCRISSGWTASGSISCQQTNTPQANYATLGSYSCPNNAPYPTNITETKTVSIHLDSPTSTCNGTQYANNSDTCKISLNISAPTNQNRGITNWGAAGNITDVSDISGEKSDRIHLTGNALSFSSVSSAGIPNTIPASFSLDITGVKSVSPFITNVGKISFKLGGVGMNVDNIPYHFRKPFTGYIQASSDDGATWDGKPGLGTEMLYKVGLTPKSSLAWNGLTGYALNDFSNEVEPFGDGLEIQSKSIVPATLASTNGTQFKARINTSSNATSLNQNPGLQINLPIVNYNLGGQVVKYRLSEQDSGSDSTPIKITGTKFLGVRVIGGIQGAGKSEFTGQQANISNIASSEMRAKIRQNAYAYSRNMTSGQIVGGVKYVTGDITISGEQDYETLIVKDGNVIINGNLNNSNKLFGIVVMKDGYAINDGYAGKGNIYVTPNVTKINAIIYADGGFISSDISGAPYVADSSSRTYDLKNQLFMNGSLFTRNTIGGSVLAGGSYTLPGGSTLANTDSNFNKAMIYDLNYVRRGSNGCDKNLNGNCSDIGEYVEPFIIKYNPAIQTNPPKMFQ